MKADSGADVCCISVEHHRTLCTQQCANTLQQSNRPLHGPDGRCLKVRSSFKAMLEYRGRRVDTTIYVLPNVDTPLLSRQASTQLSTIARIDAVSDANQHIMHQYPKLFRGLSCMSEPYRIQLKSDAQPYAVYAPCRIPLPQLPKVRDEIDRLISLGVIEQVDTVMCTYCCGAQGSRYTAVC